MVTGYMYFIESNAADNINWVHTVDNIILAALYTEGTEYVKLQIPERYRIPFKTGVIVKDSGAGASFHELTNRRAYGMLAEGIETTRANAEQVMNFFMLDRHCTITGFRQLYLVIKTAAATYVQFVDSTSTERDYCKGAVTDGELVWEKEDPLRATIKLNWRSVW